MKLSYWPREIIKLKIRHYRYRSILLRFEKSFISCWSQGNEWKFNNFYGDVEKEKLCWILPLFALNSHSARSRVRTVYYLREMMRRIQIRRKYEDILIVNSTHHVPFLLGWNASTERVVSLSIYILLFLHFSLTRHYRWENIEKIYLFADRVDFIKNVV